MKAGICLRKREESKEGPSFSRGFTDREIEHRQVSASGQACVQAFLPSIHAESGHRIHQAEHRRDQRIGGVPAVWGVAGLCL